MQKNERSKNILLFVLIVALVSLSIAYATLTQHLYITSQTTVIGQSKGWDIRFTAVNCQANGNATITQNFTMNATDLSGLVTRFNAPGDSVVCNIKVRNNGTINAKLSTFTLQDGSLTYTGTGANKTEDEQTVNGKIQTSIVYGLGDSQAGLTPSTNDTLPIGVERDLVLAITYSSAAGLPDSDVAVSGFKTTFLYVQD